MTQPPDKARLRRSLRQRRKALHAAQPEAGAHLARNFLNRLSPPDGAVIAGYIAQGGEIDAGPLLRSLAARGHRLCLPYCEAGKRRLGFRRWEIDAPLIQDASGVPAPSESAAEIRPDWLLIPLLGFDRLGNRLGQGGGHYDATLAALRAGGDILAIGLAFSDQAVGDLPREPHDQRLDAVITQSGSLLFGPLRADGGQPA